MALNNLEVVSVPVSDQERAKRFYTGQLGFTVVMHGTFGEGMRWVVLQPPLTTRWIPRATSFAARPRPATAPDSTPPGSAPPDSTWPDPAGPESVPPEPEPLSGWAASSRAPSLGPSRATCHNGGTGPVAPSRAISVATVSRSSR